MIPELRTGDMVFCTMWTGQCFYAIVEMVHKPGCTCIADVQPLPKGNMVTLHRSEFKSLVTGTAREAVEKGLMLRSLLE